MQTIENIDLESKYSEKIQPLFELNRDGYIDEKSVNEYTKFNFTKEDIPELIELAMDNRSEEIDYELYQKESDRLYFATIYAVRVLGKLGVVEAIEPLVNKMYLSLDSDFYQEAMIYFLADIGVEALDFIENDLLTVAEDKLTLFDGLKKIVKQNPQEHERIEAFLVKYLETTEDNGSHLAFAISQLVDITRVKYLDMIKNIFETKDVDTMYAGDFEDIEIKLGLKKERVHPREKNRIEELLNVFKMEGGEVSYQQVRTEPKIGRNDPCPCGSGKKYKKCCLNK